MLTLGSNWRSLSPSLNQNTTLSDRLDSNVNLFLYININIQVIFKYYNLLYFIKIIFLSTYKKWLYGLNYHEWYDLSIWLCFICYIVFLFFILLLTDQRDAQWSIYIKFLVKIYTRYFSIYIVHFEWSKRSFKVLKVPFNWAIIEKKISKPYSCSLYLSSNQLKSFSSPNFSNFFGFLSYLCVVFCF